jgi:hypothetical protein
MTIETLAAKTKLRFTPRDIGRWRKIFVWNGISEPSKVFDSEEQFREFCVEHGVRFDDPNNPFLIESCNHYVMSQQYSVTQWTLIGWLKYE